MKTFYVYGDDGQEEITADSLRTAAAIVESKITPAMVADGAWAVVRDEATMESVEIGEAPYGHSYCSGTCRYCISCEKGGTGP